MNAVSGEDAIASAEGVQRGAISSMMNLRVAAPVMHTRASPCKALCLRRIVARSAKMRGKLFAISNHGSQRLEMI